MPFSRAATSARRRALTVGVAAALGLGVVTSADASVPADPGQTVSAAPTSAPVPAEPSSPATPTATAVATPEDVPTSTPVPTSEPAPTSEPIAAPTASPAPTSDPDPSPEPAALDAPSPDTGSRAAAAAAAAEAVDRPTVGAIESVTHTPGTAERVISGWVADPDVSEPIYVRVRVDGSVEGYDHGYADRERSDVAEAFPGTGTQHGYLLDLDLVAPRYAGSHEVCVVAVDSWSPLSETVIACTTVTVPAARQVVGNFESLRGDDTQLTISGWALEPSGGADVAVRATINGETLSQYSLVTDIVRSDVGRAYPGTGDRHGFGLTLAREYLPGAGTGRYEVCLVADSRSGLPASLGCRTWEVPTPVLRGNLELVSVAGPIVTVRGWALDATGYADPTVSFTVDGVWYTDVNEAIVELYTYHPRPDVGRAYPGTGDLHGFTSVFRLPPGQHQLCPLASVRSAHWMYLGCRTVTVAPAAPVGNLESVTASGTTVTLSGWALDPDVDGTIDVHLTVNGAWGGVVRTGEVRAEVAAAYPGTGDRPGFTRSFTAGPGTHQVCAYGIDPVTGGSTNLGCRSVTVAGPPPNRLPVGNFESLTASGTTVTLTGWALDPDVAGPIDVHLSVNGTWGGVLRTTGVRTDVARAYPGTGDQHGFTRTFTAGPGTHQVCAHGIDPATGGATNLGCRTVTVAGPPPNRLPIGNFEALTVSGRTVTLTGWALDPDVAGPIDVHLSVNGTWGGALRTTVARADVARAYPGTGDQHGFTRTFTAGPGTHQVCAHGIDPATGGSTNLGCRTVTVR